MTFWRSITSSPESSFTFPDLNQPIQFEFYDYSPQAAPFQNGNYGEVGNQAFAGSVLTPAATSYLNSYNAICGNADELYDTTFEGNVAAQNAYIAAFQDFMQYYLTGGVNCSPVVPGDYPQPIPAP